MWALATMADLETRTILIQEFLFHLSFCLQLVSACSNWMLVLMHSHCTVVSLSFFLVTFDVQNSFSIFSCY